MEYLIILVVSAIILIGLAGTILPGLPGVGLIFFGILFYALYFGISTVGVMTLMLFGIAALLSLFFDYLASAYGARKFGSTKWGVIGAVIGGLLGVLVLNIPGLVLGVFAGAALGELWFAKKDLHQSLRAGLGSVIGFLGGTIIKFFIGFVMTIVFLFKVLL